MEQIKVNIPSTGMEETAHTLIGKHIVFVTIQHDADCPNPLEDCEGMGSIYSLNQRHINHKSIEEVREILESNPDAVALSYYEHGLCRWDVAGTRNYPDAQWDSVSFAGIWVPDKCLLENFEPKYWNMAPGTKERAAKLEECAQQSCDVYTEWANGNCHGFSIKVYEARYEDGELYDDRHDYRKAKTVADESCWGFIGDDVIEEAKSTAEAIVVRLMEQEVK